MKTKLVIYLSVAFLLIVTLGGSWFLWPRTPRLERYQALFLQGQYETCRADLTRFLVDDPQWLGARELLLRVELADNNPLAALPHFLFLLESGADLATQERMLVSILITSPNTGLQAAGLIREALIRKPGFLPFVRLLARVELSGNRMSSALEQIIILAEGAEPEDELDASLIRIALATGDLQQIEACLNLLTLAAERQPHWEWPAQLALELGLAAGDSDLTAGAMGLIPDSWVGQTGLDNLVRRAWLALINANRLEPLFIIVERLDNAYGIELAEKLSRLSLAEIEELLDLFPDSPLLLLQKGVSLAMMGEYRLGLDLVLRAEPDHPDPSFVAKEKHKILLYHVPTPLEEKHLRGIDNLQLMELALTWHGRWPNAADALRNRLAKDPEWVRQADLLGQLKSLPSAPQPKLSFQLAGSGYYQALPSPDGRKVAVLTINPEGSQTFWIIADIYSGKISSTETVMGPHLGYWSPNSRRLLLVNRSPSSSQAWVVNADTFNPLNATIPGQPLGWLDNDSVITVDNQTILALNAGTTALTKVLRDRVEGYPLLAEQEQIWIVRETSDRVTVDTGNKVYHLPKEYLVTSPLPGNQGVGGYHRNQEQTHLTWNFEGTHPDPLILPGFIPLWNHAAGPGLVWAILSLPGQPDHLATLSLETLTPTLRGITGGQVTAGNGLGITITGRIVEVYQLP